MSSVSARRAKAIALIKAGLIHSQSDLVKQLKKLVQEYTMMLIKLVGDVNI